MKKRNILIAAIAAAVMLAAVPFAVAGPGGHRGFARHGAEFGILGHLRHVSEELELSDAQVDQIKAIFTELRAANEPYRDQMHGGFKDVANTLLKNPNDLSAAQALLDQQAAAERAMKANLLNATSKALNVLTADQRAELAKMIEERAEMRRERRERRGGRR